MRIFPELPRVLLIHTGGTFGMVLDESLKASRAADDLLGTFLSGVPELERLAQLALVVQCNLDSSDMGPSRWKELAETVVSRWDEFDGFVVIHGTDTMAYTAAALSFFLGSLTKPIVLTGSQRPLTELRSDARGNLIDAVELATQGVPEVCVCFDGRVYRGTRATKVSNEHMQAFRSCNAPPLGIFGVELKLDARTLGSVVPALVRHAPLLDTRVDTRITVLDCVRGMDFSESLISALVNASRGFVVRGFGAGNLPLVDNAPWQRLARAALEARIPFVMASQCQRGRIALNAYENGRAFRDLGVISGADMSLESLTVKLMVMLGRGLPFERRHEFFATALAYEVTS